MEENSLVGYFQVENSLLLTAECLGKEFDVVFDGFKATLFTPSLPKDFTNSSDYLNRPLIQPVRMPRFSEAIEWGSPVGWPTGETRVFSFRIELYLQDLKSQENFSTLQEAIEEWIVRLRSNLFAFGHNIDAPTITLDRSNSKKVYFRLFSPFYGEKKLNISKKPSNLKVVRRAPIRLENFRELLEVTSVNKSLKLEYLLLKEAEHSLTLKNYRRSILDSATAFELALTNALLQNLPIQDQKLMNDVLRTNNSISKKRQLLDFTPLKLPKKDYKNKLEALRNRAIHIGKTPTEEEALDAFRIVKEALAYIAPEKFE